MQVTPLVNLENAFGLRLRSAEVASLKNVGELVGLVARHRPRKKKKRSKVHTAVGTLGNLLALKITAAIRQERAQVAELAHKLGKSSSRNPTGSWSSTLRATIASNEYLESPGVAQVGQTESVVNEDGKLSHETRYFITSVSRI